MLDNRKLVEWYNTLKEIDSVDSLNDTKINSLVRVIGTVSDIEIDGGRIASGTYDFSPDFRHQQFSRWRGKVDVDFVLPNEEHIEFVAAYRKSDQRSAYETLCTFLEGLEASDEVEAVAKIMSRNVNNILYLIAGNGEYFLRGPEAQDYLKKLSGFSLREAGIE